MPIRSTHDMLDRRAVPGGATPASQSRYAYLFPDLAGDERVGCFQGCTPRQTWDRLRAFEVATRVPLSDMPVLQMRLPAA